ncbi:MAG: DUF2309 domain-containing protein [Bacteroidia bacterium]
MKSDNTTFNTHDVLHHLKHYLPAQAPLKDFVHHNTLHAFQQLKFYKGIHSAAQIFGYKVTLSLDEYRAAYASGRIRKDVFTKLITDKKGAAHLTEWTDKLLNKSYDTSVNARIGSVRANWKAHYRIDLDALVHPLLFRILCSYLDQGISIWNFPVTQNGFLNSLRSLERNSATSFFKTKRAQHLLQKNDLSITELLAIVVGNEAYYEHYLYDQQFAHQGWSGMVGSIETEPHTLMDSRKITVEELITFELLLEIDALDVAFGDTWAPLSTNIKHAPTPITADVATTELHEIINLWQDAYEWSYYDQVLAGITLDKKKTTPVIEKSFQAMFCIDDRECSYRRYLEQFDTSCETFGTPGFFGVEFYFQPENGKAYTKLCPAPITPKYLIKEKNSSTKRETDVNFHKQTNSLFAGWLITQTVGFWSAVRLFATVFKPTVSPATALSFKHMDKFSNLSIENKHITDVENGLQIGFTVEEMTNRVEGVLKSIGLVTNFAPLVYVIGHGASSVNNPHFSAYDCGACCGRPGSANARVLSFMANHPQVRQALITRGITIPATTQFVGGLRDTTRDEISFFDIDALSSINKDKHLHNELAFNKALDYNAKERSRRFESIDTKQSAEDIHKQIVVRSVSIFEPRPELNHATNALCVVGKRALSKDLFLDRRSFMNSYDYSIDLEGKYLFNILKAVAPVCGGINLEYYFSRVDNQKLGAGSKLPHNVMGLFGVANGIDGDLRPGLPSQMIEVHDPVRLLVIVEHFPDVVLKTIQTADATYEWFVNEWVNLVVIHPETGALWLFKDGAFTAYQPLTKTIIAAANLTSFIETSTHNIPVLSI